MGSMISFTLPHHWKQDEPYCLDPIKYDPQFGYVEPRTEKKMPISDLEMDSANIELSARDFCAHIRVHFRGCIRYHAPFYWQCKGLYNEIRHCYLEERLHDMKEFEREKRLNARERRLSEMTT